MTNKDNVRNIQPIGTGERYHPLMSIGVRMQDGTFLTADTLAQRAHDSLYGRYMRDDQPLRFAQNYAYADRATMLQDLGADLCPIGHQKELGWHIAQMIEKQRLYDPTFDISDDETAIILFTGMIHDMGEMTHEHVRQATGAVVGDIPAGKKTAADRMVEKNVRLFLYENFYADVDPAVIARAEAIIAHEDDSLLHDIFEAAHETQTLETVLRARAMSDALGWHGGHNTLQLLDNSDGRAHTALALGRLVMQDHLPKFENFGRYFHMSELLAEVNADATVAA